MGQQLKPINCAIIGCGNISELYIENILRFDNLNLIACADAIREKAEEKGIKYNIKVYTVDDILQSNDIPLIINLTNPSSHFDVSLKSLEQGKHIYSEKPLALTFEQAQLLLKTAQKNHLFIGCAPDTFLGGSWQTARKIIDDNWIGSPLSATAFMLCRGHESWHPSPEFYYQRGGGPLFDMGPYYLTSLVFLLGPVKSVFAKGKINFNTRTITSPPKYGQKIHVEVLTDIHAILSFESGVICSLIMSFDTWSHHLPYIEIHGETGSLSLPDPNQFGGKILFYNQFKKEWSEFPTCFNYFTNMRGLGISDMAHALQTNSSYCATGELALHIVEIMEGIHKSIEEQQIISLITSISRPNLLSFEHLNYIQQ
ncbi:MAG: Gfo/Idh/MocA family protein [Candidatus Hydrogenedens sp.]